ncbi:MAG TPA: SdrD B-like domain-containing protein [Pirellulaceae bacterium]|nr:SdrD B-like domain-containing protein [Pirellulaceae bacterium]HMO92015.1 SdrD B-like domain-containing protein [Pirellulaceae bacterium]HMP68814.1 SdrD B-like domain-containing protein [Pirellulaceae bacterium]
MEQRHLLTANPVVAGITFTEDDHGQDINPDYFEVTFQGGSATTQMTKFVINGDQDGNGVVSLGDIVFHVHEGQNGAHAYHPFKFVAERSVGVTADDILDVFVSEDGLRLEVTLRNFVAGDRLAFTIDVDEVERLRLDPIVSGVEFEGTFFQAVFVDEHYTFSPLNITTTTVIDGGFSQNQYSGTFFDYYDGLFQKAANTSGSSLQLRADNELGLANRTAGAIDGYELVPKPISISGRVYHDANINGTFDQNEHGIGNVLISLQRFDATTNTYSTVAVKRTDAGGFYEFGYDLNLQPGTYRLVQIQPQDYLDVGASAGQVNGQTIGQVVKNADGLDNVIANIHIPLGGLDGVNYDFREVRPASIRGTVYHDRNDNGRIDAGEEGIANVLIQVRRVGPQGSLAIDPFTNFAPIFVRTDANGRYEVTGLPPGIYEIVEINANPLQGWLDGKDTLGTIGGVANGTAHNDRFSNIILRADDRGINYNFGELKAATISGFVSVETRYSTPIVNPNDPNYRPISGVTIQLYDQAGQLIDTTFTDANGFYQFGALRPGTYSVVEIQPAGYFDAGTSIGTVGGVLRGANPGQNRFTGVTLFSDETGVQYNFFENAPASISGYVVVETPGRSASVVNPNAPWHKPIAGVTIELYNEQNQLVATTTTNAQGYYRFVGLEPGVYSVVEIQPEGYFDSGVFVGRVDGVQRGITNVANRISSVALESGDRGVQYNFSEIGPASVSGYVVVETPGKSASNINPADPWHKPIAGVTIQLFNSQNQLVATTTTNSVGYYEFQGLVPDTYSIVQIQPEGYFDAGISIGSVDGVQKGISPNINRINGVVLVSCSVGVQYNFVENEPASISGFVVIDNDEKGAVIDPSSPDHRPIANVTIQLYNEAGNLVATTTTNQRGFYEFKGLAPGKYSLVQIQPEDYFDAGTFAGTVGNNQRGTNTAINRIDFVELKGGERGIQYNFCEAEKGRISGKVFQDGPAFETEDGLVPANYRDQRDGQYQPGVDRPIAGVRMELFFFIDPTSDSIVPRAVTLRDVIGDFYSHMGTSNLDAPLWVLTDANGNYVFDGLPAGNYIVIQRQPSGYVDSLDTAGSTTGFAYNSLEAARTAPQSILSTFSIDQIMDSIVNVRVNAGGQSISNNFSEVLVMTAPATPTTPPLLPPNRNPALPGRVPPTPPLSPGWGLAGNLPVNGIAIFGASRGPHLDVAPEVDARYTWHLSVINAGKPRSEEVNSREANMLQASFLNAYDWSRYNMEEGSWAFGRIDANGQFVEQTNGAVFGMVAGIPLAGDFNGNGKDEIAIFKDGYWLIDINGNGIWDRDDLIAKLGDANDLPIVGDWDGDGKADIGIYGPMWEGDPEVIKTEPGLPSLENDRTTRPKNVPPSVDRTVSTGRSMRLASHGQSRVDVIDHVFGYGTDRDIPIAGDWNGDGIRTIGTFRDGKWKLDLNGDGVFDHRDAEFFFGQSGDIPVVGDFNGNGVDQIGVFRNGTWIVDLNGNRTIDAADLVFEMGSAGDIPVVGDWDGDGISDPAIFSDRIK